MNIREIIDFIVSLTSEAAVWVATSDDVPGLVMESGSLDALMEQALFAIPELLRLDNITNTKSIPAIFRSERKF